MRFPTGVLLGVLTAAPSHESRRESYFEVSVDELSVYCGAPNGFTFDAGHVTCSVNFVCMGHMARTPPRLEHRDGGDWLVCGTRDGGR